MTKPTILIADDEPSEIAFIEELFQRAGIANPVQKLPDGQAVMDYLKGDGIYRDRVQHPFPVLLILDLVMPRKSGWEVLTWMTTRANKLPLDVVVVSKASDFDSQRMAFECGARTFLTKPFGIESLLNLLNALTHAQLEAREEGYELGRSADRTLPWFV